jgi:hypothetical protein
MILTGHAAIAAKEANANVRLNKYADPIEGAREDISLEEAREIAREDAGLIWTVSKAKRPINPENFALWCNEYAKQLPLAVVKYPENYSWPLENAPMVAEKMNAAFERGSYNYDSHAIKMTCKALGLKHTKTAIEGFLRAQGGAK